MSNAAIENLEPKSVWQFFAQMAAVPRASKREEQIRAHTRKTAEGFGFKVREDAVGNMIIEVPATKGHEKAPIIVLQGHLDMVCEKNAGTQHDFDRDPIRLVLDKDEKGEAIVRADGTTLGADNGIGVALALAAATSPDVVHGPLEILCTIDEEMGMTGAQALAPDFFKGRRMLNLDSEEDDAIYIGCAGGCDSTLTWNLPTAAPAGGVEFCRVNVSGLRGGHTGGDIHENRGNAVKLLVRTLRAVDERGLQLVEIAGGSKRNAIPREAHATVAGPSGLAAKLKKAAAEVQAEAVKFAKEPNCTIAIESATAAPAATPADTATVLTTLTALPHGVLAVVPDMPGLVQTSNSTSTIECATEGGKLRVTAGCLSRSSLRTELEETIRRNCAIGQLGKADVVVGNGYPGWAPNIKSPTLGVCKQVYKQLFGAEPKVTAIHAGLECGLIGERLGEGQMDMVSFGPHISGAHSPDERVWVKSVAKSYQYLCAVLKALA